MKIVFILSSLCDNHFSKRVIEFIEHGYEVEVYGFKRKNEPLMKDTHYTPHVFAEIESANHLSRIPAYLKAFRKFSKFISKDDICFYSSLDIALFARVFIKNPYLYEVCDLTELGIKGIIGRFLRHQNKVSINASIKTILTSQGFVDYFGDINKEKISLIPNRLNIDCPKYSKAQYDLPDIIRIGFVGAVRYESVYKFIKVCAEQFRQKVEIHIFGYFVKNDNFGCRVESLVEKYDNLYYHGRFSNPIDLPSIYDKIDLSLATYAAYDDNVKYAEPNKLYEAIYFRCPIIVSEGVFLGDKVKDLNVGYAINALDEKAIYEFLATLNNNSYQDKLQGCMRIEQKACLNINEEYFAEIGNLLNNRC